MTAPRLMTVRLASYLWCSAIFLLSAPAAEPLPGETEWWQRGQDTWYYKDDWKASFLSRHGGLRKTLELPQAPEKAYAYV